METNYWGPGMWNALHSITFDFPENATEQDRQNYRIFFHSLKYVLPCASCREHYKQGIENDMPIELDNRDSISRWLVNFHNSVNKRLGKPEVSYESVKEKYESMRGVCNSNDTCKQSCKKDYRRKTDFLLYFVITLLIVIICLVFYYLPKMRKPEKN
jgi:hypothetical protein